MAIIQKLITLVRGTATEAGQAVIDANALKILDQEIRDADTALNASRSDLTKLMAERHLANDKLTAKKGKLQEYNDYIQQLINKNDTALATEVAGKVAELENDIAADTSTIAGMDANVSKLNTSIHQAQSTIEQLKRQIDTVKATASVQRAQEAIASQATGSNVKLRTAMDSLDRIKNQQALKSAQIDAANELQAQDGDGDLQQRLQAAGVLPGATAAADVLARFKKADA
jgi:Phage shock protein A (IM30), suppresses sigma54-dependent transcription